ncbi:MAG: hypothetical protein H6822_16070 [Planctomycetaceae bacterium]|nr:hypothetical protein [Planctomycetales bacterium]MCB9923698.1 hypothetical protein [Planctomycetaceae bacterium]
MNVSPPTAKWRNLGIAMLVIAGLWGKVFPRLERVPSVQHRIKQLDELGVDTAAFFYTDHEGMKRWETEVDAARRNCPTAFW